MGERGQGARGGSAGRERGAGARSRSAGRERGQGARVGSYAKQHGRVCKAGEAVWGRKRQGSAGAKRQGSAEGEDEADAQLGIQRLEYASGYVLSNPRHPSYILNICNGM